MTRDDAGEVYEAQGGRVTVRKKREAITFLPPGREPEDPPEHEDRHARIKAGRFGA